MRKNHAILLKAAFIGPIVGRLGMKIVVLGGTGLIGSKVVNLLRASGHEVVAASPSQGINSITGEGLTEALTGAQVVVDVTNSPSFEDKAVLGILRDFNPQRARRRGENWRKPPRRALYRRQRAASGERILARESSPGKPDQGFADSLHDSPRDAVL